MDTNHGKQTYHFSEPVSYASNPSGFFELEPPILSSPEFLFGPHSHLEMEPDQPLDSRGWALGHFAA